MKKLIPLLSLLFLLGCTKEQAQEPAKTPTTSKEVVPVANTVVTTDTIDVPEVTEDKVSPRDEARSRFPEFVERLQNPQAGDANFMVKIILKNRVGTGEYWIKDIVIEEPFNGGTMVEDDTEYHGLKIGQYYSFLEDKVVDWKYESNGKVVGNFLVKAGIE